MYCTHCFLSSHPIRILCSCLMDAWCLRTVSLGIPHLLTLTLNANRGYSLQNQEVRGGSLIHVFFNFFVTNTPFPAGSKMLLSSFVAAQCHLSLAFSDIISLLSIQPIFKSLTRFYSLKKIHITNWREFCFQSKLWLIKTVFLYVSNIYSTKDWKTVFLQFSLYIYINTKVTHILGEWWLHFYRVNYKAIF